MKLRQVLLFIIFLIITVFNHKDVMAQEEKNVQMENRLTTVYKQNIDISYLLYLPKNYESGEKFPLVLFLHGAGERGTDLNLVKKHGLPKLIEQGKDFPFIVVSPQCPLNVRWDTKALISLIDELIDKLNVDEKRIYITGLSMGGNGTWRLISEIPERIAAAIPICGWGDAFEICNARNVSIWAFHGAKDMVVPVVASQQLIDRLKYCNGKAEFTIYDDLDHDSWTVTYENEKIYEWLLEKSLP
ncbi:MAG: dienelactone hydrolase family protein [Melioribacteraceae bacterium]|nr:dienelactone hydrolase family protein [Melioribacteraceae bacterium]